MTATALRTVICAAEQAAGLETLSFQTITDVEIAHVGMDWPASTGPVTLTMQHLADAVTAANDDPHILPPRLKIGHTDPRFNEDPPEHDPFAYHGPLREDGNPVYGKVTNLRLAEDGMVLVGDYVEVPNWLSDALPSAYPSRSLEGDFDVETEGGKKYSFVITAVALLGEPLPAISCLEDLVRELTGGPAAVLEQAPVTLTKEDNKMPILAEASTDSLRSQFFDTFAQGERYWWWPCEIRVEDAWILADDDEGHLYRVPVTTDDNGIASFGEPVAGVLDFREIPDPDAGEQEPVAASRAVRFSSPAQAGRPRDRVRAATDNNERSSDVDISTLREQLEMPDATDDEVIAAAAERLSTTEAAAAVEENDTTETTATTETQPVAASGAVVDPDALAELQRDAQMGREAREAQLRLEREQLVDERIRGGFITSASRAAHLTELEKGGAIETAHRQYLASLTAAIVPVGERGHQPANQEQITDATRAAIRASFGLNARKES